MTRREPEFDVNGQWVGYGLGDTGTYVLQMKKYLLAMFASYAAPLQASLTVGGDAASTYDQTMVDVVTEMQTRYLADPATLQNSELQITGIMNYAWQIRCGFVSPPMVTVLTWAGTFSAMTDPSSPQPYGAALAAQQIGNLNDLLYIQPIGNYPATITNPPMGTSAAMGVTEGINQLQNVHPTGKVILFGYSQGAICSTHTYRDAILNPEGPCHNRLSDILLHITFGNPQRTPGQASGNAWAIANSATYGNSFGTWSMPGLKDGVATGGISGPDCFTPEQTPAFQYDFVWMGTDDGATELYTNAPVGAAPWSDEAAAGWVGTLVYNAVLAQSFTTIVEVAEAIGQPVGMIEEIYNGITFAVAGNMADHYQYDWAPAVQLIINYVREYATTYVNSGGTQA